MEQLEAHEVQLYKVFSSDFDFHIPEYQRPYAWEAEQAGQLLDDLIEALDRDTEEPYFLGSVVLVKTKESPRSDVIDGQQRLTTLTILFAVLRDLSDDPDLQIEIDELVSERGSKSLQLAPKPRLTLRQRDTTFFKTYIQTPGSVPALLALAPGAIANDAQRSIQGNAAVMHAKLSKWDEQQRLRLVAMLNARTFLVVVRTPDLNSAHRIFSVMNARGLDLSPADIFKSLIIGDLPDEITTSYAERWEDAEEALGREDFADLFLHLRMIFAKVRGRRELLKEFPEQVLTHYLPGQAATFVDDVLVPYADAYEQIRGQAYTSTSGAPQVNAWFTRLTQLDNNDWRPPALWALRNHGDDPQWLDQFLRLLERLAASMFVRRVYATPRSQRYADLLRQLDDGKGLDSPSFVLSEEERRETMAHLGGEIYLASKTRKYVLLRLDETLANNPGVTYDHGLITVEHVLPQHPSEDSGWTAGFSEDDRAYWTHRLANLVLLNRAKNSEAQNYDFEVKKEKYFRSSSGVSTFALTSQVLNTTFWTPSHLDGRQADLLGHLKEAWQL